MVGTGLRGRLNYKRVASYFKRSGLTVRVERTGDGEYLLSDKLVLVKALPDHEIKLYTNYPDEWASAHFDSGKGPALQSGKAIMAQYWQDAMALNWHSLTVTRELRETPGEKGKPGTLWRKFTFEDGQRASWFNKVFLDLISPDLDELDDFLFEQSEQNGPMRVAGVYGPIALVMPGRNVERA